MKDLARKFTSLLATKAFFYVILGFFVFEALWFVFSAVYPMAFDEDFHFGIIKIYAGQWSPFLWGHPEGADAYGAVARDPSYLFHYLMSFPYRIAASFTQSETLQVIVLRLINLSLFTWSLVLFRRVLLKAGTSPSLVNASMAVFVLIPIVPMLAAHINYDNLLVLLVAWLSIVTFKVVDSFRQQRVDMTALLTLVIICLFAAVVKYAALPILMAATIFVLLMAANAFRGKSKLLVDSIKDGYASIGKKTKIILFLAMTIGLVLFTQRYAVNVIKYDDLVPDCGKVITVEQCMHYGPWGRDYQLAQNKPADFKPDPLLFIYKWVAGMRHRLFFMVNGAKSNFHTVVQLPVPAWTATILFVAGLASVAIWWRKLFVENSYFLFFGMMIAIYVAVLFFQQYSMYVQTAHPVAINGRYLIPVMLPMAALLGTALTFSLRRMRMVQAKPYIVAAVFLLMLHGGGLMTFILRSDANWYWPNQVIVNVNDTARKILSPIIIEGDPRILGY